MEKLRRCGEVLHIDSVSFSLASLLSFRFRMVENLCFSDFKRSFLISFYNGLNYVISGNLSVRLYSRLALLGFRGIEKPNFF